MSVACLFALLCNYITHKMSRQRVAFFAFFVIIKVPIDVILNILD